MPRMRAGPSHFSMQDMPMLCGSGGNSLLHITNTSLALGTLSRCESLQLRVNHARMHHFQVVSQCPAPMQPTSQGSHGSTPLKILECDKDEQHNTPRSPEKTHNQDPLPHLGPCLFSSVVWPVNFPGT
jgi:hypothetical protein